jgi:hypothetical protein
MGWREFGSITILSRMMLNEGVRGSFIAMGDQETPLGFSTLVKDPKVKTTQRSKQPMRD